MEELARMLVPRFVCGVSRFFGFVWLVGVDDGLSRKKCGETCHSALLHSKREFTNIHARVDQRAGHVSRKVNKTMAVRSGIKKIKPKTLLFP